MVKFELRVHLVLVPQGGVDGIVLGAGCLAGGYIPGDVSGLRAGSCVGKPIKQTFICKHWFYGFDW